MDTPVPTSGHEEVVLHSYRAERVRELVAAPDVELSVGDPSEVEELLVLEGTVAIGQAEYPRVVLVAAAGRSVREA